MNVTQLDQMTKYHESIKSDCKTQKRFRANFMINQSHITEASVIKNQPQRRFIFESHIASIIFSGVLNLEKSKINTSGGKDYPEIAVEGILTDFEWADPPSIKHVADLAVRIVIQKHPKNHFVLSVYPNNGTMNASNLPKINSDIWD